MSWSGSIQRYLADTCGACHVPSPVLSPLQVSVHLILTTTLEVGSIFFLFTDEEGEAHRG